jgi:hypothetical protein
MVGEPGPTEQNPGQTKGLHRCTFTLADFCRKAGPQTRAPCCVRCAAAGRSAAGAGAGQGRPHCMVNAANPVGLQPLGQRDRKGAPRPRKLAKHAAFGQNRPRIWAHSASVGLVGPLKVSGPDQCSCSPQARPFGSQQLRGLTRELFPGARHRAPECPPLGLRSAGRLLELGGRCRVSRRLRAS